MDKGAVNKKKPEKKKMVLSFPNVRQWMSNRTEGLSRHHLEGIAAASVVIATWFFIYWKGKESDQPDWPCKGFWTHKMLEWMHLFLMVPRLSSTFYCISSH